MGPVILDLSGVALTAEERELILHPLVGGIVFFTRNFESPEQITALTHEIRRLRGPMSILICVDHEGGRVQRFREGFTRIPSMGMVGALYEKDPAQAKIAAELCGWLIATELFAVGIDLSFTPVLDLNKNKNTVIGDRSFHHNPAIVIELATALMRGMHNIGMAATGKHFPGHGDVTADSHLEMPRDSRSLSEITAEDFQTFSALIQAGIQAMMPAHIIFPAVDNNPVGFSKIWLKNILRNQLKFTGMIFSDDLNMEGAAFAGDYPDRARMALEAGCEMVLICNNRQGAIKILDSLPHQEFAVAADKFKSLQGKFSTSWTDLNGNALWQDKRKQLQSFLKRINNEYNYE